MEKEILKPTLMIAGIMGFIICILYTSGGQFSEWFSFGESDPDKFDFGTNLGIALSTGFLLMFLGSLVSITPKMIDDEFKNH